MKQRLQIVSSLLLLVPSSVIAARIPFGGMSAAFATPVPARDQSSIVIGQPSYAIASSNLSEKWIDLVKEGKVAVTVNLPIEDDEVSVRYGVRLVTRDSGARCEEFVEEIGLEEGRLTRYALIQTINATLTTMQEKQAKASSTSSTSTTTALQFALDGDFAAQLQLVRTLRPPPSPGFSESTTSIPPEYDASTDSFVTGPLRLELRPLVATLEHPDLVTPWDVFHNVSPADTRGHFLLLPTLSDQIRNWRGQAFTKDDCNDLVHLASSIDPVGSLLLGFNSVGAGASQNHIHCHAWPSPPGPLMLNGNFDDDNEEEDKIRGWNCYAVSKVNSLYDVADIQAGNVEVSYLNYPVFCVQLSASQSNLRILRMALTKILETIGDAPYNIGFLNRRDTDDDEGSNDSVEDEGTESMDASEMKNYNIYVDVYVFVRCKERSHVLPSLKLGISEMMGVFHAQSDKELQHLVAPSDNPEDEGPMPRALRDVSYERDEELWNRIKSTLIKLNDENDWHHSKQQDRASIE